MPQPPFYMKRLPGWSTKVVQKKEEGTKVLKNLIENLSAIMTFFDPCGKLSMMCMIPVSITILDSH